MTLIEWYFIWVDFDDADEVYGIFSVICGKWIDDELMFPWNR